MVRAFLLSLAVCGMLVGCSGSDGDVPSSPGDVTAAGKGSCANLAGDIATKIADLFPDELDNPPIQQCNNIQRELARGNTDDAIGMTFDLIVFVLSHFENGRFDDPDGSDTTALVNALLDLFGLGPLPGDLGDENTKTVLCEANTECIFTTESQFAGFSGTFTEPTLVTIFLRDDDPFALLEVTAFPLIFDFSTQSASDATGGPPVGGLALAQLTEPATVAVCVVDPPDPAAPSEEELANLALGHVTQGSEGDSVEILPDAPPGDFALDCEGASSGEPTPEIIGSLRWWGERAASAFEPVSDFLVAPLLANPGERRGLITAFSPVGAIDTTTVDGEPELVPTATSLELENSQSCCGFITDATANVSEDIEGGDPVFPGDVEFVIDEIEGDNDQSTVRSLNEGGSADIEIVCDGFSTGDQILVPQGSYTVQAVFEETTTHAGSSSEPQGFACVVG